jgi:Cd2+/Zn2+-exporting ATPase
VSGTVDGRRVTVGRPELFAGNTSLAKLLEGQTREPSSLMVVAENDEAVGYIEVADEVRPESADALRALRELDSGYRFVMLTGDRAEIAQATADRLGGIDEIRSDLLPEQKLDAVRDLEGAHGAVAMIGDGINDTPALAGARLGIAMGGAGSHQAMDAADIVLMQDDLMSLPRALAIARKARQRIAENIALSLGLKLVFLALAIPGLATLWMAVLADVGTTLLVTLNGMRMLRADAAR